MFANKSGKQGFRDTKAIFCLLGKLPNPHRTLPAASGCASVPDASTAVPAKEKSPVQHEHYTHTAPDFPSSTTLSIFFFLPHFLLMQLLFFLLVLFQDFLHNLLCHKPILHFRFGLAVLCIGAFLSFQKHCILCVQLADARELFVRTVLFLIGIKSRAAQKSRRCTPCGMISCFIRLFSLAILVPRVLLACFLRSKTDHFRGPRTAPKALNFPANRRRETYRKVGKIIAC